MGDTRFIVAGNCIDGSGGAVRRNVFLAVEGGVIAAIGSVAELSENDRAAVDDLSHCTVLPALVDCSVSLLRSPSVASGMRLSTAEASLAEKRAMLERHIHYCHTHGVLGVADSDDLAGLKERLLGGMAPGRIIAIRAAVPSCRGTLNCGSGDKAGADFLRVGYSGNIEDDDAPSPRLGQEELCRILQRRGGKKAIVVANGRQQVADALAAGCDAIEQGYGMGAENLRQMAEQGVLWIPSVLRAKNGLDGARTDGSVCCRFSQCYVAPGEPRPGAEAYWKKILAEQLSQLRLAREFGVTTAVGTGAGSAGILHGEAMVEEMKLFIKAGYSLEETIRCASENGAAFFGMAQLGALGVGRRATFLVTRGTVAQLPRKLSYLEGVYIDGLPSGAYRKNPVKAV